MTKDFLEKLVSLSSNCDLFLIESPMNDYKPAPPNGYIAVRSSKRRLFVKTDKYDDIQSKLDKKEYIESLL